jgi:hypothetical protein
VQVQGSSIERLATTVIQQLHSIPGVTSTSTSLILAATPLREAKTRARKPARRAKTRARKPARKAARRRRR